MSEDRLIQLPTADVASLQRTGLPPLFVIGALTALYIALISVRITRHLWFDELLTYHIAQIPSIREMLRIAPHWDLNPPLSHLLSHLALRIGRGNPIAVRVPSVLEYYFAGVFLFLYSRRKLGPYFAAVPVLLLWYGPIFEYATEARPYAAICFWFCALLLLWDHAIERRERSRILATIAICSLGLLASHVFGTLTIFAFAVAEAVRASQRKKADWPLWIALFAPLLYTVTYIPLIRSYRTLTDYPPAFRAGPHNLAAFYWHNFAEIMVFLALVGIVEYSVNRQEPAVSSRPTLRLHEISLFTAQLFVPILLTAVLMIKQGAFWGRYCIASVVALYFAVAWFLFAPVRYSRRAGYATLCVGALLTFLSGAIWPLWKQARNPIAPNAAVLGGIKPDLPLVTASGLTFVEMGQYESPALLKRVFYLQDHAAAVRLAHATMFDDLNDFHRAFHLPGQVVPYQRFVAAHREFLVLATPGYPEDWVLQKLASDGASITRVGDYAVPYKDKQLFDVQMSDGK